MREEGLITHVDGLPEWWAARGNQLLGPEGLEIPPIIGHDGLDPPTNARLVFRSTHTHIIMPGASIGDDTVVGIRSVVSGSIPANVVVAGAPARIVRQDVTWTYEDGT
jgi:hypothetical protein